MKVSFVAQWLAYTLPCQRFADILTDACARLGADVVRYSFIVVDFHHLLLAGLPAHSGRIPIRAGEYAIVLRTSPADGNWDIFCGDMK